MSAASAWKSANTPRRNLQRISESISAALSSVSIAWRTASSVDVPAIDLVGEVHLVGAAAIVIGAARAHREPERHRLQRPRLVAGNLEALHLRRERDAAVADRQRRRGGCPRPAGRRGPRARPISSIARSSASPLAERQPRLVEQPRSTHSIAKAIVPPVLIVSMPELVAALRRAQHGVGVADAAQRAQREQALVLEAHAAVAERVDVLAADRAGDAARARAARASTLSCLGRQAARPPRTCRSGSCASAACRSG